MGHLPAGPDCMDKFRLSYLVEDWFLARKVAWALSGCMTTDSVDYCMFINEWAWSSNTICDL